MKKIKSLQEYEKKYKHYKGKLVTLSKKEVIEFDKKYNTIGKKRLLNHKKWALFGDTYYEIPRPIRWSWFKGLNTAVKTSVCILGAGVVATAVAVPTYLLLSKEKASEEEYSKYIDFTDETTIFSELSGIKEEDKVAIKKSMKVEEVTSEEHPDDQGYSISFSNEEVKEKIEVDKISKVKIGDYELSSSEFTTYEKDGNYVVSIPKELITKYGNEVKITPILKEKSAVTKKAEINYTDIQSTLYFSDIFITPETTYDIDEKSSVITISYKSKALKDVTLDIAITDDKDNFLENHSVTFLKNTTSTVSFTFTNWSALTEESNELYIVENKKAPLDYYYFSVEGVTVVSTTSEISVANSKIDITYKYTGKDYIVVPLFIAYYLDGWYEIQVQAIKFSNTGESTGKTSVLFTKWNDFRGEKLYVYSKDDVIYDINSSDFNNDLERYEKMTLSSCSESITITKPTITLNYINKSGANKDIHIGAYNEDDELIEDLGTFTFTTNNDPISFDFSEFAAASYDDIYLKVIPEQIYYEIENTIEYLHYNENIDFDDFGYLVTKYEPTATLEYINTSGEAKTFNILAKDSNGKIVERFENQTFGESSETQTMSLTFTNWDNFVDTDTVYLEIEMTPKKINLKLDSESVEECGIEITDFPSSLSTGDALGFTLTNTCGEDRNIEFDFYNDKGSVYTIESGTYPAGQTIYFDINTFGFLYRLINEGDTITMEAKLAE